MHLTPACCMGLPCLPKERSGKTQLDTGIEAGTPKGPRKMVPGRYAREGGRGSADSANITEDEKKKNDSIMRVISLWNLENMSRSLGNHHPSPTPITEQ